MEILTHLALGFTTAVTVSNLLTCFMGVLLGTLVGVLPGLGPMAVMSMLLPLTYSIGDPTGAIIFMAGLYYGAQYGGSTTAILLNLPGEASSVVTTIDGYQMTQRGRAGAALAIAALASFTAGTVATAVIALLSEPLSDLAFAFGPAEYASLMLMGLVVAASLSQGSVLKSLGMVMLGILLGLVGTDTNTGIFRFTNNIPDLADGINFGIVAMGLFGLGEVLYCALHQVKTKMQSLDMRDLYPTKKELHDSVNPALRGTLVGSILGLLPGGGAILSSFASYTLEKKIAKNPQEFGRGAVAGVAGPEAANNAGAQTSFIPMLSLGLPVTPIMALMIATLMINHIQPGPQVLTTNPELFWGLIVSMWIGNLMLVILNLPLIGIWTSILRISWKVLYPLIVIVCVAGAYYINNSWFDVVLLIPCALVGYVFKVLDCEPAPLAMGFVIGAMFEEHLRRALTVSRGDWMIFLDKPLTLTFLSISLVLLAISTLWKIKHAK